MDIYLKEDHDYYFNNQNCRFFAELEIVTFKNPKAVFKFEDGTETSYVYDILFQKYSMKGKPILNGNLEWNGSAWMLRDFHWLKSPTETAE